MGVVRASVRQSSGACWLPFWMLLGKETWLLWKVSLQRMLPLTRAAVGLLAAPVPVVGCERGARFIAALSTWCWKGVTLDWVETNGQAAVLVSRDGVPFGLTIDASAQGINEIMWFLRPSKLNAVKGSPKRG